MFVRLDDGSYVRPCNVRALLVRKPNADLQFPNPIREHVQVELFGGGSINIYCEEGVTAEQKAESIAATLKKPSADPDRSSEGPLAEETRWLDEHLRSPYAGYTREQAAHLKEEYARQREADDGKV